MDQSQKAVSVFDKVAQLYQDKYMNVDLYATGLDLLCDLLPPNAHILELACGPGNVTRYVLDKRPDLQIVGTDLAPNMLKLAQSNNPEARFEIMDCRDIPTRESNYDAIIFAFCLPYTSKNETLKMIADAARKTNPNGLIYISTIEDNYTQSRLMTGSTGDQIFIHFHESGYLVEALEHAGFAIKHLERIRYQSGENDITDLIIVAQKQ